MGTPGQNTVGYWKKQLHESRERVKGYRECARQVVDIYEAKDKKEGLFNILYSNTETLLPALYNVTPKADVQRRYKDEDKVGMLAAEALKRALNFYIDSPDRAYTRFDDLMGAAVVGALVPGEGLTRIKYDAIFKKPEPAPEVEKEGAENNEGEDSGEGTYVAEEAEEQEQSAQPPAPGQPPSEEAETVDYEMVCGEEVAYDRLLKGAGRKWASLPWISFEHRMTRTEVKASFKGDWTEKLPFEEMDRGDDKPENEGEENKKTEPVCVIQEIWHKRTKQVLFICENYAEAPIKIVKDPYELSGFFPCPEPLQLSVRLRSQVPIPIYEFYKSQAKELNEITRRITKVTAAIKIRGYYDSGVGDIKDLLSKDDNVLLPATFAAAMREGATPENSIWLMPIDKLIVVLQQLVMQREQVKQVIYEITGISDILRGSSVASETATAQNIKNQWGTLRLKRMQRRVQNYVRDTLRIVSEMMCKKFGEDTWEQITGMHLQSADQKKQAQQIVDSAKQSAQANPDPQAQQQLQQQIAPQVQAAQEPSWAEVVALLKDDLQRAFRLDIETNSTLDPEAVEDKQAISELLGAIGQMSQTMGDMVNKGVLPLGVFRQMLLSVVRRYSFGPELETELAKIPDQLPQPEDPKAEENKAKLELTKAETQGKLQLMEGEAQLAQKELEIKTKELALKERELALKDKEMAQKEQLSEIKFKGQMQVAEAKSAQAMAAAMAPPAPPAAPHMQPQTQATMGGPGADLRVPM